MLLKIISRIWPALLPIFLYLVWVYFLKRLLLKISKKKEIIDGEVIDDEKIVGEKSTQASKKNANQSQKQNNFSLQNRHFVFVLYLSLVLAILSFIALALN